MEKNKIWPIALWILLLIVVTLWALLYNTKSKMSDTINSKDAELEYIKDQTCFNKWEEVTRIKAEHDTTIDSLRNDYKDKWEAEYEERWGNKNWVLVKAEQKIADKETHVLSLEQESRKIRTEIAQCDKPKQSTGEQKEITKSDDMLEETQPIQESGDWKTQE
jgi:hypothetical protein